MLSIPAPNPKDLHIHLHGLDKAGSGQGQNSTISGKAEFERYYQHWPDSFEQSRGAKVCAEAKGVRGKCRAAFRRWTFDKNSNECEEFIYGGCDGNGNNFKTREDCEKRCVSTNDQECVPNVDCINNKGKKYRGEVSRTKSGLRCKNWKESRSYKFVGNHNYCRNKRKRYQPKAKKPWCFTVGRKHWEYCDIPRCSGCIKVGPCFGKKTGDVCEKIGTAGQWCRALWPTCGKKTGLCWANKCSVFGSEPCSGKGEGDVCEIIGMEGQWCRAAWPLCGKKTGLCRNYVCNVSGSEEMVF